MDEKDYEIILTLHKLKNITKTSEKLFISQPALTKRIKKIERDLGIDLIIRSKKGVIFTPLGESVIPYIKNVTNTLNLMRQQVESNHNFVGGTLNIGISLNYSHYRLPEVLKNYTEAFPNVDVKIVTDQSTHLYHKLENDEISLAVLRGEYKWDEESILLNTEPICFVCNNKNMNRPLDSFTYIGRHVDSIFQAKIQTWLIENGLSIENTKFWIDDIETCLDIVKEGLGWTILPKICLNNFNGYIKSLYFADGTPFTRSTYILYKKLYYSLPQVKLFIQYLLDNEKSYQD
ncbi:MULTISPECIES: LysR family transcriptional regulator [Clostridium]|uniref:LysR family transcriptional regulator n=1 Tax=Clostridium lapidicellarium TaxID=3240931 RepID=A0ABV4DYJ3_9CLOT|nr:LysR family transcriptional regulator [Clostridiales bacterium]